MAKTQEEKPDIRDMLVVHESFRHAYGTAPALVRAVGDGDTARARTVADHLDLIQRFLHLHHQGEDDLLWPKLLERAPEELNPTLALMESQHVEIDRLQNETSALLKSWRHDATASDREKLAHSLRSLGIRLAEHLAIEEGQILPLVRECLTVKEWNEIADHSINALPKTKLPMIFGMLAYFAEPDVVTLMLAGAPAIPRVIMPLLGPRAFAAHAKRVYGTATPAR